MDKKGNNHNERATESVDRSGSLGAANVYGLLNSYRKLSKSEITPRHKTHHQAMHMVLEHAVSTYATAMAEAQSRPRVSEYTLEKINENFDRVVQGAQKIDFPQDVLTKMSLSFIDHSLDYDTPLTQSEREAAAKIGLAIGGAKLDEAKVLHIVDHQKEAIIEVMNGNHVNSQIKRAQQANDMIGELNFSVKIEQTPSVVDDISKFTREHARSLASTGAVAVVAASILAPSVANAASSNSGTITPAVAVTSGEQPTSIEASPNVSTSSSETGITVALPAEAKQTQTEATSISTAPTETMVTPANVTIPAASKAKDTPTAIAVQVTPEAAPEAVAVTDGATIAKDTPTTVTVESTEQTQPVNVTPTISDKANPANIPTSISVVASPPDHTPSGESLAKLTPDQRTAQTIVSNLNSDGDVSTAASLIRLSFHDKTETATSFSKGEAVYATTNNDLVKNVHKLEITVEKND